MGTVNPTHSLIHVTSQWLRRRRRRRHRTVAYYTTVTAASRVVADLWIHSPTLSFINAQYRCCLMLLRLRFDRLVWPFDDTYPVRRKTDYSFFQHSLNGQQIGRTVKFIRTETRKAYKFVHYPRQRHSTARGYSDHFVTMYVCVCVWVCRVYVSTINENSWMTWNLAQ